MKDLNAQMRHQQAATDFLAALAGAEDWLTGLAATGPDLMTNAHVKAAAEAQELADNPTVEEWADVMICLVGTAVAQGWHIGNLADAVDDKVIVNRRRTWEKRPDGTWQHQNAHMTPCPCVHCGCANE